MGRPSVKNFINGASSEAKDGRTYDLVDPVTGEVYASAPRSQAEDVEQALRAADQAFGSWSATTPSERSRAILRFADALEARSDELVDIECRNTGKPRQLTVSEEIPPTLDQIRFFAGACRVLEGRAAGEYMHGFTSFIRREPVGVCAAGHALELPHDDGGVEVRSCHRRREHGCSQAGATPRPPAPLSWLKSPAEYFPPGVFNVVCGHNGEIGAALLGSPIPRMVSITGSVRAGHEIAQRRGRGPEAGSPRTRWKGAGCRVRRRRHRSCGRGHCDGWLLQRGTGLHRRHPGSRAFRGPRRIRGGSG